MNSFVFGLTESSVGVDVVEEEGNVVQEVCHHLLVLVEGVLAVLRHHHQYHCLRDSSNPRLSNSFLMELKDCPL